MVVLVLLIGLMFTFQNIEAQVIKEFKQRTSSYTPETKIYNIKGDFQLIGNINMTLSKYSDNGTNDKKMIYVDVDEDSNTINSSSATLSFSTEGGADPNCSNIIYAGLYWTGRAHDKYSPEEFSVSKSSNSKTLNKRKVKLKKAGGTYQTITAQGIYFPDNTDGYMYSAYAEVTDYVKANKTGKYFVADIALQEGEGGSTGFYGGWGLIVVYENSKMKWRDVTIFDGHAYVASKGGDKELSVSGFNTVQEGPVGIKLGVMAGEGDADISGDQFKIRNAANEKWVNLSHGGNSTNNFFNSSIYTGDSLRSPKLKNNTGLDISMFTLDNEDNSLIGNRQTSTSFQYSSTQDTYIIFCIAMAVDAYIPEVEVKNSIEFINNIEFNNATSSTTVYPNDVIEYTLYVKNLGSEMVKDSKIEIPIPFTTSYVSASDEYLWEGNPSMSGTVKYDSSLGGTGTIVWDIGNIPLSENKDEILAKLTYKLKVTNDCFILNNSSCIMVSVDGYSSGTGVTSGASFANTKFVTGFIENGTCSGQPIHTPLSFNIDVTDYLANQCIIPEGEESDYYTHRKFKYCGLSRGDTIPFTDVSPNFPKGSQFYSGIDYDENKFIIPAKNATSYTATSGFPLGTFGKPTTYYAIPPGMGVTCYWEFTITVDQYCGNYWHGTESSDWEIPNNWTAKKVPETGEDIEFATVANNKNDPAQQDLYLDTDRTIGNLINNSDKNIVVTAGNQLIIDGIVKDENPLEGTIVIKSDSNSSTGTLIFTNPTANTSVDATVEFINNTYKCDSCGFYKKQWQYFGIPIKESAFPYQVPQIIETINQWIETYPYNNKWQPAPYNPDIRLKAFKGYEITSSIKKQPTLIYNFSGILNVGNAIVPVTKTENVSYSGINLIGNSFTAAIPITSLAINLGSVVLKENTAYLFNMGTRDQWRKLNGGVSSGIAAGQYQAVPFNLAGKAGIPDRIPSMHTFMLNVTTPGNITLQYNQLTKNKFYYQEKETILKSNTIQLSHMIIDVIGSGSADRIWLFEHGETTTGFDNGWDGYKMKESNIIQAYICGNDQSDYQIATVPEIVGTTIGVKTTSKEAYTINLSVTPEIESRKLYLRDLFTGKNYPIVNNADYVILNSNVSLTDRFKITDSSSTLIKDYNESNLINIYVRDNTIIVENQAEKDCIATVYDQTGRIVANKQVRNKEILELYQGNTGIYIVKVVNKDQSINKTDKIILK